MAAIEMPVKDRGPYLDTLSASFEWQKIKIARIVFRWKIDDFITQESAKIEISYIQIP